MASKHRANKGDGPAVGFEALLDALTAAQDQTALADGAGKPVVPGLAAKVAGLTKADGKATGDQDEAGSDSTDATAKDGAATALDAALAAQDAATTVPQVIAPAVVVAPPAPAPATVQAAPEGDAGQAPAKPVFAPAVAPAAPTDAPLEATETAAAAATAAPLSDQPTAGTPQTPATDEHGHDPKAYGLAKLDSGQTIPAAAAADRRIERAEARSAPAPATSTQPPAAAAPAPSPATASAPATAPAQAPASAPAPEADAASPTDGQAAGAAATATAEAGQAAPAATDREPSKDGKGNSRYARNEVERAGRAATATGTATATATAGSTISAKMGDVAQTANDAQAPAAALAPSGAEETAELPAAAAAATDSSDPAAGPNGVNSQTASTTAPATVTQAAAPLVRGQPQTVAALAAQIIKKLDGRSTRFDVALDPIGLGHVNVRLEIGAEGKMTAAMAFDTPQAAAELRGRAAELRSALEQSGFDISGGMTFDVAADNGQSQGSSRQEDQPAPVFRGRAFQTALDTIVDPAPTRAFQYSRNSASGVDIRI